MTTAVAPRPLPALAAFRSGAVLLTALASVPYSKLALPAALFTFLSFLSIPREPARFRRTQTLFHGAAALISACTVVVFMAREAVPGMVQGGTSASGGRAVSRLREMLFAEDSARKDAAWDPDGDGVGSALLIGELTSELGMRGAARLVPPLLERYPKSEPLRAGSAVEIGGYWFMICLPTKAGGFSSDPHASFDDELAERRYLAYAWPSGRDPGLERAYFLDEHERILGAPAGEALRHGSEHPPACDDAIAPATRDAWRPWREKKAREDLPGAR